MAFIDKFVRFPVLITDSRTNSTKAKLPESERTYKVRAFIDPSEIAALRSSLDSVNPDNHDFDVTLIELKSSEYWVVEMPLDEVIKTIENHYTKYHETKINPEAGKGKSYPKDSENPKKVD